jgi:hypothetical protein
MARNKSANAVRACDHDDILAQYVFAFGAGAAQVAGSIRVHRGALHGLRETLAAGIDAATWEADAAYVLELLRAVGRLAALEAVKDGRISITHKDTARAYAKVWGNHPFRREGDQSMGTKYCPSADLAAVPGDHP